MKKLTLISLFLLLSISSLNAQALEKGTVTDIDSNIYHTVVFGKYVWIAENLKTTTYNNGTKIPNITEDSAWVDLSSGAYCWYNNDKNNANTYGALYNWYSVNTGKLCPDGWRVPTDDEWKYLEGYVDTQYGVGYPSWNNPNFRGHDAGKRLMATSGWKSNGNGTDNFGFTALPGGERLKKSQSVSSNGFWWSSTQYDASTAWYRGMIYGMEDITRNIHPKRMGFSVRCIRNK